MDYEDIQTRNTDKRSEGIWKGKEGQRQSNRCMTLEGRRKKKMAREILRDKLREEKYLAKSMRTMAIGEKRGRMIKLKVRAIKINESPPADKKREKRRKKRRKIHVQLVVSHCNDEASRR